MAADMLNDRVVPWYEEQSCRLLRILTDRGTEYCGNRTKTKARSPETNGICERFQETIQNEFYAVAFRKKVYTGLEDLQRDLDKWILEYNTERTHSGKYCYGKTPMQTFLEGKHLAEEKMLDKLHEKVVVREVVTVR